MAVCQVCGIDFQPARNSRGVYCGLTCRNEGTRRRNRGLTGEKNPAWRGGIAGGTRTHYVERWKKRNPEKHAAKIAVRDAVRRGDLVRQPCERCGVTDDVHAHHDDYTKPLEVMWLCRDHHRARHAEIGLPMHRRRGQTAAALAARGAA